MPSIASSASNPEPAPVPFDHGHGVQADRVRPVGRAGGEHARGRSAAGVDRHVGARVWVERSARCSQVKYHDLGSRFDTVQRRRVGGVDVDPGRGSIHSGLAWSVAARERIGESTTPIGTTVVDGATIHRGTLTLLNRSGALTAASNKRHDRL